MHSRYNQHFQTASHTRDIITPILIILNKKRININPNITETIDNNSLLSILITCP